MDTRRGSFHEICPRAGEHAKSQGPLDPSENKEEKWLARLHRHGPSLADLLERFCQHAELMLWSESVSGVSERCWRSMQHLQSVREYPSSHQSVRVWMGAHSVKLLGAQPTHKWSVRSTISAAYVHIFVNIGCIVMRSNLSVMKRFTVARHFSGHAV